MNYIPVHHTSLFPHQLTSLSAISSFAYQLISSSAISYQHPVPRITTHTVFTNILKSSHKLQLSIYSRSSLHQSLKSQIWFLPRTCHRQVIPGLKLIFLRCQNSYRASSCRNGGLGPTRLISPLSTLHNCGSSSRLNFLSHLPTPVILGSSFILNTGPFISLFSVSAGFNCSAFSAIIRKSTHFLYL